MKIAEIVKALDKFAPRELAEDWDKIGLMVGSEERECSGVLIALDLTVNVAKEAIESGCNLIVTHHPFIFNKISQILTDEARGEIIELLIKNDITVFSAHTNLDKAKGGICWKLAELFEGKDTHSDGLGVVFECEEMCLENFARKVAKKLADKSIKVVGNPDKKIKKVFVVSGGGGDMELYSQAKNSADVFVTGDIKHHIYVEAQNDGFPIVEFSHYSSEIIVVDILYDLLKPQFESLNIKKARQQCPYKILEEL